jgi:DNA-nicking Smr family endonuclease
MARLRALNQEDLQLWAAFSQSLTLLPGKTRLPVPELPVPVTGPAAPQPVDVRPARKMTGPVATNLAPSGLDKATWRKFAGGKVRAGARLDLHGHTASRAHHAVTHFLTRAHAEQIRCVEIITGNGDVLARELPMWLNAAPLRPLILAIAHPHAANTGSVRILLRRVR